MMKWIGVCSMVAARNLEESLIGPDLPGDADLIVEVLKKPAEETCDKAVAGDFIHVHYTGWSKKDGVMFDSSIERDEPIVFPLGAGVIIPGWDQGLVGMCVGEQRRLTIPSGLAYGEEGAADVIKPNATLIFDVELVDIGEDDGDFSWDDFEDDL